MYFYGLSINIMTLGGLALGAGMLVDNAIVIVENIFRNLETGQNVKDASIRGTTEVGGAIISSTLTTIVVFLPIVYLHGASGALFKDQAWTVAFSQVASLFVAIIVIPMLFFRMYAKKPKVTATKALRFSWYSSFLNRMLDHRKIVIAIACVVLVATALILPRVGSEYVPQGGTRELNIDIKLKEGTQLQRTEGMVINLETMLKELLGDNADMIFSQIGSVKSSVSEKSVFQNENSATLKIRLQPMPVRLTEDYIAKIGLLTASIPDAEVTVTRNASSLEATLGTNESPLMIEVTGRDFRIVDTLTQEIKLQLDSMGPVYNLKTSIEQGAPEIDVVIDRNMASIYGLTADNISAQLKDLLMGKNAGKFDHSGEMNDITVRLPELGIGQFNAVMIKGSNGSEVPLYEIADIRRATSPKQLLRNNQNRISRVTADIDRSVAFDKVISDVKKKIGVIQPPDDYQITVTGEEQKRQDAMSNLGFALVLSIVLVYMVMASQFESLIHPFTVLLTIPLAGAGSVWAFFILGKSLNIMAYIGIIMLGGIAVNNSILLVDAINQFRGQGHSLRQSILLAGQNRIRPILLTSLSSILGLLPLTIGFGESAALRSPMAIALIAGLTASTVMSLVVIPCVYYIFDRKTLDTNKT
jgi:HAE1 family hydrophobic/amphiphilic exporter-1